MWEGLDAGLGVGWDRGVMLAGERGNVSCGFSFFFLGFGWVEL